MVSYKRNMFGVLFLMGLFTAKLKVIWTSFKRTEVVYEIN